MLPETTLFLFYCNAGPVANKLVGTGQRVEQRSLTAVGIARQGYLDLFVHDKTPFKLMYLNRRLKKFPVYSTSIISASAFLRLSS